MGRSVGGRRRWSPGSGWKGGVETEENRHPGVDGVSSGALLGSSGREVDSGGLRGRRGRGSRGPLPERRDGVWGWDVPDDVTPPRPSRKRQSPVSGVSGTGVRKLLVLTTRNLGNGRVGWTLLRRVGEKLRWDTGEGTETGLEVGLTERRVWGGSRFRTGR